MQSSAELKRQAKESLKRSVGSSCFIKSNPYIDWYCCYSSYYDSYYLVCYCHI